MALAPAHRVAPARVREPPRAAVGVGAVDLAAHVARAVEHLAVPFAHQPGDGVGQSERALAREDPRAPAPFVLAEVRHRLVPPPAQRVEIRLVLRQRVEVDRRLDEVLRGQRPRFLPRDHLGRPREEPLLLLDEERLLRARRRQRVRPRAPRGFEVGVAERGMAARKERRVGGVGERTRPRRARERVRHRVARGVAAGHGMARRLDPRADAAVRLLARAQVPEPPLRLVEDVGDAVRAFGDRELPVAEVAGPHQVRGAEVVDDREMRGPPVVVGRVVPAARERQPLAARPVGALADDVEPAHALRQRPFLGREDAAHDVRVARPGRPVRPRLRLGDAAPLLVEPAHVDAERLFRRAASDAEVGAAPDAVDRDVVDALVRDAGEIHLVRLFARERRALLRRPVGDTVDGRRAGGVDRLAARGVHDAPRAQLAVRPPRTEPRAEPRAEVGELRLVGLVADLVDLEERARDGRIVVGERRRALPVDGVDDARRELLRERIDEAVRRGPVARLRGARAAGRRLVRLPELRVGIEVPHARRGGRGERQETGERRQAKGAARRRKVERILHRSFSGGGPRARRRRGARRGR